VHFPEFGLAPPAASLPPLSAASFGMVDALLLAGSFRKTNATWPPIRRSNSITIKMGLVPPEWALIIPIFHKGFNRSVYVRRGCDPEAQTGRNEVLAPKLLIHDDLLEVQTGRN